jgi:hypothetical protein
MMSDKICVLVKADTHTGIHVDLAMELGLPVSILNTTVNNHEATKRSQVQCIFSKKFKSLKYSTLQDSSKPKEAPLP